MREFVLFVPLCQPFERQQRVLKGSCNSLEEHVKLMEAKHWLTC